MHVRNLIASRPDWLEHLVNTWIKAAWRQQSHFRH